MGSAEKKKSRSFLKQQGKTGQNHKKHDDSILFKYYFNNPEEGSVWLSMWLVRGGTNRIPLSYHKRNVLHMSVADHMVIPTKWGFTNGN